jgi:uncharacterized OsmC-like protein
LVKRVAKIKVTAKWVENVQSIADNMRDHGVVLDLGTASGGTNKGPSALELAIMSLADCAVTIFANVCKKKQCGTQQNEGNCRSREAFRLTDNNWS